MPGGRPSEGKQQRYPELEELASWFRRALARAGYSNPNEFLRRGMFEKNAVYGVVKPSRPTTSPRTQPVSTRITR
jgi:hypothetical protein